MGRALKRSLEERNDLKDRTTTFWDEASDALAFCAAIGCRAREGRGYGDGVGSPV